MHTPLVALPVLFIDLETTGLDVRNDRIVQLAAVAMLGTEVLEQPRLEVTIDPGAPIPPAATRIHGIGDADVAGAPRFADVAPQLRELFAGRVVVGHHVAFDLGILRFEAGRVGLAWHEPSMIDLAMVTGALYPELPDLSLETLTTRLNVELEGRHSAIGDCLTGARCWSQLLELLREADVRTLGESQSLAARRNDLQLQQMQMGWFDEPGDLQKIHHGVPHTRIDSYAFERKVGDLMSAPPRSIDPGATLRAAARTMVEQGVGALLVGEPERPPIGILTERDLLRATASGRHDLDATPVDAAMSAPVQTMRAEEMLYRALGRMDRLRIRHLCVVDDSGNTVGMVSQRDLLHHRARGVDMLEDALTEADDLAALAAAFARVPDLAERLLAEELDGSEVARVVSVELRTLTARAAELSAARLEASGRGPAPAPWCLLVLGSGGRGESLLGADQDNALIHAGEPADDPWFAALGESTADMLDQAGVARCEGEVMAASVAWRGDQGQWRRRIDDWLRRARPEDLLSIDIFFDLTPVTGSVDMAFELQHYAVERASRSGPFIALMAQSVDRIAPRLGLFGSLPRSDGRIDLKRDGLLPLVSLARTLALRVGSHARATPERLRDASAAGRLPARDADTLIKLHTQILNLVLRQQLLDVQSGVRPSGRVERSGMTRRERTRLRGGLKRLDDVVKQLGRMVSF